MSKKLFLTLSAATLLAAPIGTARADLVLAGPNTVSGSGIGTVNTILTVQANGSESGCVGRSSGGLADFIGTYNAATGACSSVTASGDVKTGNSQTQTQLLAGTGVTNVSNFGVIFNAAEPGGDAITLSRLSATFYSSTGAALFTASTAGSLDFGQTFTGTGNAGYLFTLNATQQAQAITAGAFAAGGGLISGVRVGIGASLTGTGGGNETFFVGNSTTVNVSTVPEPSTYALMAAGLAGVFGVARRRRNRTV